MLSSIYFKRLFFRFLKKKKNYNNKTNSNKQTHKNKNKTCTLYQQQKSSSLQLLEWWPQNTIIQYPWNTGITINNHGEIRQILLLVLRSRWCTSNCALDLRALSSIIKYYPFVKLFLCLFVDNIYFTHIASSEVG